MVRDLQIWIGTHSLEGHLLALEVKVELTGPVDLPDLLVVVGVVAFSRRP